MEIIVDTGRRWCFVKGVILVVCVYLVRSLDGPTVTKSLFTAADPGVQTTLRAPCAWVHVLGGASALPPSSFLRCGSCTQRASWAISTITPYLHF